jgi:predicted HTH domain antitoxin
MNYAESGNSSSDRASIMRQFPDPINLEISPDSLSQGEQSIRQTLALQLYAQDIFTFGQARRLADVSVWEFQQLLAQHNIQRHYSEIELAEDNDSLYQQVLQRAGEL